MRHRGLASENAHVSAVSVSNWTAVYRIRLQPTGKNEISYPLKQLCSKSGKPNNNLLLGSLD